jgi:hypothetical protein
LTYYLKFPSDREVEVFKQKLHYHGQSFDLHTVFKPEGAECVICISDPAEITLMPCGHCCMCTACSKEMQVQSGRVCPICRASNP